MIETTTKLPLSDFFSTHTIIVGKEQRRFVVHTTTLTQTSRFFQDACEYDWAERKPDHGIIYLQHIDPSLFEAYIRWCYGNESGLDQLFDAPEPEPAYLGSWNRISVTLYALAHALLDKEFAGAITPDEGAEDDILRWDANLAEFTYTHIPTQSTFTRLLCEDLIRAKKNEWFKLKDVIASLSRVLLESLIIIERDQRCQSAEQDGQNYIWNLEEEWEYDAEYEERSDLEEWSGRSENYQAVMSGLPWKSG